MRKLLSSAGIALAALAILGVSSAASAANVDSGRTAYAANCASCHAVPSSPWSVSALSIQGAIQSNRGGMGKLASLSAAELQDIAAYLANPAATAVATTSNTLPATGITESDRIFDWAETAYSQRFGSHSPSQYVLGYYSRYYPATDVYLATRGGQLYFYNAGHPDEGVLDLGPLSVWLTQVGQTNGAAEEGKEGEETEEESGGHHHHKSQTPQLTRR